MFQFPQMRRVTAAYIRQLSPSVRPLEPQFAGDFAIYMFCETEDYYVLCVLDTVCQSIGLEDVRITFYDRKKYGISVIDCPAKGWPDPVGFEASPMKQIMERDGMVIPFGQQSERNERPKPTTDPAKPRSGVFSKSL